VLLESGQPAKGAYRGQRHTGSVILVDTRATGVLAMAKHVITKDNSLYVLLYGTFGATLSLRAASMTAQKAATRATKRPAYLPG